MKQILIERQGYSERIERMFGKGMVVSLTGQRRVGKSCVMRRIYEKYSLASHLYRYGEDSFCWYHQL